MSISIPSNGKNETPRIAPSRPNSFMCNHKRGSSSAAARLIVMVIYWRLYSSCWLQNTLCVYCWYSPRVVGGKSRKYWKPFVSFYYLFLHTVYKNSKPNQGREHGRIRCRGSHDNPSSVLRSSTGPWLVPWALWPAEGPWPPLLRQASDCTASLWSFSQQARGQTKHFCTNSRFMHTM